MPKVILFQKDRKDKNWKSETAIKRKARIKWICKECGIIIKKAIIILMIHFYSMANT